jgi:hypothetical protein
MVASLFPDNKQIIKLLVNNSLVSDANVEPSVAYMPFENLYYHPRSEINSPVVDCFVVKLDSYIFFVRIYSHESKMQSTAFEISNSGYKYATMSNGILNRSSADLTLILWRLPYLLFSIFFLLLSIHPPTMLLRIEEKFNATGKKYPKLLPQSIGLPFVVAFAFCILMYSFDLIHIAHFVAN